MYMYIPLASFPLHHLFMYSSFFFLNACLSLSSPIPLSALMNEVGLVLKSTTILISSLKQAQKGDSRAGEKERFRFILLLLYDLLSGRDKKLLLMFWFWIISWPSIPPDTQTTAAMWALYSMYCPLYCSHDLIAFMSTFVLLGWKWFYLWICVWFCVFSVGHVYYASWKEECSFHDHCG